LHWRVSRKGIGPSASNSRSRSSTPAGVKLNCSLTDDSDMATPRLIASPRAMPQPGSPLAPPDLSATTPEEGPRQGSLHLRLRHCHMTVSVVQSVRTSIYR